MVRTGRHASSRKAFADDTDAITPCPPPSTSKSEMESSQVEHVTMEDMCPSRSPSPSSCSESEGASQIGAFQRRRNSVKTIEEGTEGDPERLWKRMLALQQIYGCYRSARMSAALELGDASSLLPSKACLDLMNEDMDAIPDDVEAVLKKPTLSERLKMRRNS
ncbi:hypothetical protein SCUP234_10305 [Seiridium cupressi]